MELIKETVMLKEYERYLLKEGMERQGDWEEFLKALTSLINATYAKGAMDDNKE